MHVMFVAETNFGRPWYYYNLDDGVFDEIQEKRTDTADKTV